MPFKVGDYVRWNNEDAWASYCRDYGYMLKPCYKIVAKGGRYIHFKEETGANTTGWNECHFVLVRPASSPPLEHYLKVE